MSKFNLAEHIETHNEDEQVPEPRVSQLPGYDFGWLMRDICSTPYAICIIERVEVEA